MCLIRNGVQVLQTQVMSVQELLGSRDTCITFPNRMAINNVDINFKVKIDVYALEILPRESNANKTSKQHLLLASNATKFFSPFKMGGRVGSSFSYGRNASHNNHHYGDYSDAHVLGGAKTSNFIHVDTIEITQRDMSTKKFKLNISSSSIPLTGSLFLNVRCMPSKSIELKGFMSLFEDIGDQAGAWDRRWCFLNNYNISFWKYPEDEYRDTPLGIINLTRCSNERVALLPRDMCARKYTIELEILDEANGDRVKKYRLSADTKDQANDWVTNVNYALANLKLWNSKSK